MNSAFGHADFYPHGGRQQPQCGANFNCSHGESYRYYIDSVRTGGCGFAACTAEVSFQRKFSNIICFLITKFKMIFYSNTIKVNAQDAMLETLAIQWVILRKYQTALKRIMVK